MTAPIATCSTLALVIAAAVIIATATSPPDPPHQASAAAVRLQWQAAALRHCPLCAPISTSEDEALFETNPDTKLLDRCRTRSTPHSSELKSFVRVPSQIREAEKTGVDPNHVLELCDWNPVQFHRDASCTWDKMRVPSPNPHAGRPATRGIVMAVADVRGYAESAFASLAFLRERLRCTLPVELFFVGRQEMSAQVAEALSSLPGVTVMDLLPRVFGPAAAQEFINLRGYQVKPMALHACSFDHALLTDANVWFVRDPSWIFDTPGFRQAGIFLMQDYCASGDAARFSQFPRVFGVRSEEYARFVHGSEIDSCVVGLDKGSEYGWHALHAVVGMALDHERVYCHTLGDKETFGISAFLAVPRRLHHMVVHDMFAALHTIRGQEVFPGQVHRTRSDEMLLYNVARLTYRHTHCTDADGEPLAETPDILATCGVRPAPKIRRRCSSVRCGIERQMHRHEVEDLLRLIDHMRDMRRWLHNRSRPSTRLWLPALRHGARRSAGMGVFAERQVALPMRTVCVLLCTHVGDDEARRQQACICIRHWLAAGALVWSADTSGRDLSTAAHLPAPLTEERRAALFTSSSTSADAGAAAGLSHVLAAIQGGAVPPWWGSVRAVVKTTCRHVFDLPPLFPGSGLVVQAYPMFGPASRRWLPPPGGTPAVPADAFAVTGRARAVTALRRLRHAVSDDALPMEQALARVAVEMGASDSPVLWSPTVCHWPRLALRRPVAATRWWDYVKQQ